MSNAVNKEKPQMLDIEEIDTLIDALSAWENKDFGTDIMMLTLGIMMVDKSNPEQKSDWERRESERKQKQDNETNMRKETSMILKAKLIQMKKELSISKLEKMI